MQMPQFIPQAAMSEVPLIDSMLFSHGLVTAIS
jgi:hypothetical protein